MKDKSWSFQGLCPAFKAMLLLVKIRDGKFCEEAVFWVMVMSL